MPPNAVAWAYSCTNAHQRRQDTAGAGQARVQIAQYLTVIGAGGIPGARCLRQRSWRGTNTLPCGGGRRHDAIGVARLGDAALLRAAGADVVVTTLDDIPIDELASGGLPSSHEEQ